MAEAAKRLNDYVMDVVAALSRQDGKALADQLRITTGGLCNYLGPALEVHRDLGRFTGKINRLYPLGDMFATYLACVLAVHQQSYLEAYKCMETAANMFLQEFRNWESAWAMEAIHMLVFEIRMVAEAADRYLLSLGKVPEKLKAAGSFLMKVFGAVAGKGPKKVGALYVGCQLFKIYFKLNTVHLCKSIIRIIAVLKFEDFPKRDKVTYMYYTGRLAVFNDDFESADEKLTYALQHCDASYPANVRRILKYLIPVRLSRGVLPSQYLLKKHNLTEFSDIVRALCSGDMRLFRHALEHDEEKFLRAGVYLVLEKLELRVFRRLIKRIYLIQRQRSPPSAHQIKMDTIQRALTWLGIEMDLEEVECITAILIYRNLMKGYLSHKSKVVVLSKMDPFPHAKGTAPSALAM